MGISVFKCTQCGGGVQIPTGHEFTKCEYCGSAYQVEERADGSLKIAELEKRVTAVTGRQERLENLVAQKERLAKAEQEKRDLEDASTQATGCVFGVVGFFVGIFVVRPIFGVGIAVLFMVTSVVFFPAFAAVQRSRDMTRLEHTIADATRQIDELEGGPSSGPTRR
jgi:DNA-directed RNA polymerase subunit RPC12/RpoP